MIIKFKISVIMVKINLDYTLRKFIIYAIKDLKNIYFYLKMANIVNHNNFAEDIYFSIIIYFQTFISKFNCKYFIFI